MKNNFQPILDAYQLVEGAVIKGKEQEELFEVGSYDPDKRGYTVYPYQDGARFDDFNILVTEDELMDNYVIESKEDAERDWDEDRPADTI
ncbi:hypothetical protein [Mucilaginibacter sp.]|jgi:hypothetical protein|uniref:hypothetical protein n=1 Tax=Mucilaginibacter sp. TaxID=1882438 RepID=UPI002CD95CCD|nr:hypothetical protein [Mucilaginibacter sp.]HTI61395.1 hypothetical protein [Mucilaginibacter sp.]